MVTYGSEEPPEAEARRARRNAAVQAASKVLSAPPRADMPTRLAQLAQEAEAAYQDSTPDQYGTGPVRDLERRTAELLGLQDAAFFPTGTMAQQVALRCWAGRTGNPVVAVHPLAHPEVHERGALQAVSGLRTVHPTTERRLPTAREVRGFEEPFGTLMLELPLRDAGFVLPSWEELVEVVAAARDRDAVVHFDGARLWECTPHFGRSLPEIAGLADSVYVSYYKSLGGLSGAALAGSADLIAEAKAWRHRYGGLVFQQYPAALAAQAGLRTELPRLASYVLHARTVAEALRQGLADGGLDLVRIHPPTPHTHQFQLWLAHPARALDEASLRQAERTGLSLFGRGTFSAPGLAGLSMTEVTVGASALEWTPREVHEAAEAYAALVAEVLKETEPPAAAESAGDGDGDGEERDAGEGVRDRAGDDAHRPDSPDLPR